MPQNTDPGPCIEHQLTELAGGNARGVDWARRHWLAWLEPRGPESPIRDLIVSWAAYGKHHREVYGQLPSEDGFLGPSFKQIGENLIDLLNGDLGRFDGGTLDQLVRAIAAENGFHAVSVATMKSGVHEKPGGTMLVTEIDPVMLLMNLLEKRTRWLSRRSGRRINEELDRVRLFERNDVEVCEVWVEGGRIEEAKAHALTIALEIDRQAGMLA